jgi:hypothetical protein
VSALLICLGVVALVVAGVDVLWTVLAAGSGAGPLTARLSALSWKLALWIGRQREGPRHTLLALFGIAIVVGMLLAWVAVAVVAWTTIFSASEGAVREASTGQPASLFERAWFVGYSLFTLGSGPYSAGDGLWQLAAVAAGASGLVMVTLAIAYLVPVASAVTERRRLAQYVFSLGWTPEEIVVASWTGDGFGSLIQHLVALTPMVHLAGEHHLTYPAVDYFHSTRQQDSSSLTTVVLDDAITLLRHGVAPAVRPDPSALEPLSSALRAFLGTVEPAFVSTDVVPLPEPELARLRKAGIPTVGDDEFEAVLKAQSDRRRLLARLLADDGWTVEAWDRWLTGQRRA